MDQRRVFGNEGEALAAQHLKRLGYAIMGAQVRTPFGELDLVACDGEEVVFVEVKTRRSLEFGYPESSVTRSKLAHIAASGESFLASRSWESRPYRIDVIAIMIPENNHPQLEHFKGVDPSGALW